MSELAIPALPVIRSHEQYSGEPYSLTTGVSPTVGWQWLPQKKGGPVFAVLTRRGLGSYKIAERFPLTDDGWACAWQALARLSPANAAEARRELARRAGTSEREPPDEGLLVSLRAVVLLGGYASKASLRIGERYDIAFFQDRIAVHLPHQPGALMEVPYADAEVVDIGGPGLVKSGGGFAGGGFGAVGALEGMAIASVLNALTTKTTITTIVRIQAPDAELFLLYTSQTPEQLRMRLSEPLGSIRAARAGQERPSPTASPVEELAKLASMLENGLLTRAEFDSLKARLLAT